ncbi:hypothetical protein E4T47_06354 [Aureobasidium subglaciale]|nr:hypothetical protein E4T47_06354 [Aureobasidium subglaciale]
MSLHTQSLLDYYHSTYIIWHLVPDHDDYWLSAEDEPSQDRLQRITIMEETVSSEAASFHNDSADDIVELHELGDRNNNQPGKEPLVQNIATHDDLRNSGSSNSLRTGDKEFLPEKFGPQPRMWYSTWLHLSVLTTFLGAFLLLLVIILVLYEVSVADNGLATQVQSRHYAWTYGPTALLGLCRNVDFANRQLAPWKELAGGPSSAKKTLLLNYVSPALPMYLLEALKNRHWAVVASTSGTLLLKLIIVLSTGLIALEPTWVSKAGNPSAFNAIDFPLDNLTGTPGVVYYGIRTQSLPYPKGTGTGLAVQEFRPQVSLPDDTIYSAAVEGFTSDLDCEVVQVDNSTLRRASLPWYSVLGSFFVADINAGNCSLKSVIVAETPSHGFHHNAEATQNFQGRMTNVTCSDGVDVSGWPTKLPDHSDYPDQRILMTMADLRWLIAAKDMGSKWQSHVPLCLNMYQVDFPIGTESLGDQVHAVRINESSLPLPGVSDSSINYAVVSAVHRMYIGSGGEDYVLDTNVPNFFQLLGAANNDSRQEAFMDPTVLRDIGSNVWNGVAAQIVHESMMQPTDDVVVGSVRYSENRLQVKLLSVILMMVALGLLCLLVVIVMLSRSWNVVPRDPFSISAVATLLAANPAIIKLFDGRGASRRSKLQEVLEDYSFESKLPMNSGRSFTVDAIHEVPSEKSMALKSKLVFAWWHPLSTKQWFVGLAVALPLTIIGILEILQHLSDKRQGLATVEPNGAVNSRILSNYLPALVMFLVAALFTSIQASATIFSPYSRLKRGNVSSISISTDLVGKMPLHALVVSTRSLDLGHSVSLLAVLVAASLTIIVSGLFTAMPIPGSSNANMTQIDRFDFVRENLSISDNNAGAITSLIEWSRLSSPDWTHNDLAFNRYELLESSQKTGIATVDIPAYRARLDCDVILNKTYSVNVIVPHKDGGFSPQSQYTDMVSLHVEMSIPPPCLHSATNATSVLWQQDFYAPKDYTPNYVGQASVLQWEADGGEVIGDGAIFASSTGLYQTVADGLNVGGYSCPSLGIVMGSSDLRNHTKGNRTHVDANPDLQFVMCFQRLEMVLTSVKFNIPDMSINTTMPPKPDESTVTIIQNPVTSNDVWEWSIDTLLTSLGNGTNPSTRTVPAPPGGDSGYNNLDWFLDTIIEGKNGVRVTDLVGQGNTSRDFLIKSSQRLYGDYMAQAFSANIRDTTAVPNTTILARINNVPHWRLKQNPAPKIALQVILGFLDASAIATYLLLDMREVLPHNPCSIASVASLLADSKIVTREVIPEGAEWLEDRELRRMGVFEGLRFYLGWQKEKEDEDRKFAIFVEH